MPEKKGKIPGFMKEMGAKGKGFKGITTEIAEERHSKALLRRVGKAPGFAREMAASGKKKERTNGRKEKSEKITRLMKKGYRKGYRVPKRPKSRSGSRKSSGR